MPNLLEEVINAHGGLSQWERLSDLVTEVHVQGTLCPHQEAENPIPHSQAFFSLREQRIVILSPDSGPMLEIKPDVVTVVGEQSYEPPSFRKLKKGLWKHQGESNFDARSTYVLAFALRHFVTAPFLYATPGFAITELEPWVENDELWRVLRISFPPDIAASAREQLAYYGPDGLLRRTRYKIDCIDGAEFVNYVTSYQEVDGIRLPVSREIFACDAQGRKLLNKPVAQVRLLHPFFTD